MDFYKNQIIALPELFDYTINLVPDISLLEALGQTQDLSSNLPVSALEDLGDRTYMPRKWTIRHPGTGFCYRRTHPSSYQDYPG